MTRARNSRPLAVVRESTDERIEQLYTALQRAEAERDASGAFLSYISNELRTPLTTVVGMADLLKESQLSPDQRDMIAIMRRSADHLIGIVNNSLDLARLDAGRIELESRPFQPRLCAEECLDLLTTAAAEKGLDLAYEIDDLVPSRLLGDGARVRQIMVHLVGNAVKYTGAGEVVVSLSGRPVSHTLHELHVAVRDSGPGIPADRLDAILMEFSRGGGTVPPAGGNGLGLSISRRLVEMMGGRIWVETRPGRGSTFHFTITAQSAGGEALESFREPGLAGKRLLIVENSFTLGAVLARTVERWGMDARATTDANEAVDWLQAGERYDMILIDGRLPDRRNIAAAIRGTTAAEAVPLVLLTSLGAKGIDESLAGTGGRARFAAYLSKPIRLGKLHELLVRVLATDQSRSPDGPVTVAPVRRLTPAPRPAITDVPCEIKPRASDLAGARIVIADDEPAIREILERTLRAEGVEVVGVGDGEAALAEVTRLNPDVVLLDIKMPKLDGYEVCRRLKGDASTRLTPVVLVTGRATKTDRIQGIEAGADDILLKPWERQELLARMRALVRLKRFTSELDSVEAVLVAMAQCMESRDPDTQGHCARLSDYASRLGRRIGLDDADVNALRLGGILHDIGKVAVPDAILFKAGPLTDEEWAVMREHPVEGARICAGLTSLRRVLPVIRHHHEKLDGTGYPDGLRGEQIPPTARVLQIVDIYDALTTKRAYKNPMSSEEALEVMQGEVDRGWRDARIFKAFQELVLEDAAAIG